MEYLPTPSRAGTKVLKGRTDIMMPFSLPWPPLPLVLPPPPVRKNPASSTITRSVPTSPSTATTASAGPSTRPITPVSQETPAIAGPSTRPLMPAIQATCGIAGPPISVLANVPISTSYSTGNPSFWARATQYKRKLKEHPSEVGAPLSWVQNLPVCRICDQPTQGHKKYKKKSFCHVKMMSSSKALDSIVYDSYENFTSVVDKLEK
ncbi:hypothetical protein AOLI_G00126930 [Acnodon oligacanthus]